jgi:SAM-dependent methyltransferase
MAFDHLQEQITRYYTAKVEEHGPTARGVDWNSPESQGLRFSQLLKIVDTTPCSVLDYGCGYGALADYLGGLGIAAEYRGFDAAKAMIDSAIAAHPDRPASAFIVDPQELSQSDYVVASGIFNVRLSFPDEEWQQYMVSTVERLASLSRRGFSFNALSLYSDPEKRRPDLHYADPLWWFDHCKRHITSSVALLHDYPLYEFTLLVRH